jgi:DNA-binding response OmpR family regulator
MKILGIDDNEDLLQLYEIALTAGGHEYTGITSGQEGFKAIQEEKFDLVLLDLSMPDFSGLDVLDAIQKDGIINKPIIVLATASTPTEEERKAFLEKGVHSFLAKPLEPDVLLDYIEKINSLQ